MADPVVVLIAAHLEKEQLDRIRAVDRRLEVHYEDDLVGKPKFPNDHSGPQRTPEKETRFLELLKRAEVMFDFDRPHLRDLRAVAPRLRWVQSTSSGIGQMVKRTGLDKADLLITTSSGVHARPLADFALMAMLMFAKDYPRMEREKRAKHWERYCGMELTGQTLAVVGAGRVGREVARLGKLMDMRVTGMRRSTEPLPGIDKVYQRKDLVAMLREADFIVLAAPHTAETEGMVGEAEIAAMKPTAVLINIGRGQLIDEPAFIKALQEGRLAGAALDVFGAEPPPPESPFWEMPNVIISPHSASTVLQENDRIVAICCDNLQRYLSGKPLQNVLDTELLY